MNLLKYIYKTNILKGIRLYFLSKKINSIYPQNDFIPMTFFSPEVLCAEKFSYGELNIITFNSHSRIYIGKFVSIAQNVYFLLDVEHDLERISTYPFREKIVKDGTREAFSKGDIIIDDDVWIGFGAIIMSGVHIHQGAVVAAGSIVTHDVMPYSIVGGVPAKIIRYRFDKRDVKRLSNIEFGGFSEKLIKDNLDVLLSRVDDDICLDNIPQKSDERT